MAKLVDFHTHSNIKKKDIFQIYNIDMNSDINSQVSCVDQFVIGIHPWDIDVSHSKLQLSQLREYLLNKKNVGLGECGLDRSIETDFELQVDILHEQFKLAKEYKLQFIVIHCVRAYSDIVSIYKDSNLKCPLIFHDYNGNENITRDLLKRGFFFSVGIKSITDNKRKSFHSLSIIPVSNIFFETDNSSLPINQVYEEYALFKGINVEDLKNQVWKNLSTLV